MCNCKIVKLEQFVRLTGHRLLSKSIVYNTFHVKTWELCIFWILEGKASLLLFLLTWLWVDDLPTILKCGPCSRSKYVNVWVTSNGLRIQRRENTCDVKRGAKGLIGIRDWPFLGLWDSGFAKLIIWDPGLAHLPGLGIGDLRRSGFGI